MLNNTLYIIDYNDFENYYYFMCYLCIERLARLLHFKRIIYFYPLMYCTFVSRGSPDCCQGLQAPAPLSPQGRPVRHSQKSVP